MSDVSEVLDGKSVGESAPGVWSTGLHDLATGLNTTVQRITMGYNTRGRVETITQNDDEVAGQGSVVDEVKYTYDDWGNVTTFDQDVNSADKTMASNNTGATLGYGALSDVGNRFGYTGHEYENALSDAAPLWHARPQQRNRAVVDKGSEKACRWPQPDEN